MDTPYVKVERAWQARWFHFVLWMAILAAILLFLHAVEPILLPFVLGMLIAYMVDPIVNKCERWRLNRSVTAAILTLGLFTLLTLLVMWLTPILYQQTLTLIASAPAQLHALEQTLREEADPLLKGLNTLTGGAGGGAFPVDLGAVMERTVEGSGQLATRLFTSGAALLNLVALLLITPIVCFYLIRDWPSFMRKADALLPLAYAPTIREQLRQINRTLSAYVRGQLIVMVLMSIFYTLGLTLTGLHFSLMLGLLAGCIIIIPYIGSVLSIGLGLFLAHAQFGMENGFWLVVTVYGIGQIVESQILTPKIIGDRVGLHPLWMLFGMLAGAVLLGFTGVLLAVPLTAVIGVLAKFTVNRYMASGLYQS